ncbi:MAG: helix-turn-helix transcriptional regulator [Bacteroidia bacterium]|nr:helix-turn-helix transcriptional regulator [Bacteroidia bacterium]
MEQETFGSYIRKLREDNKMPLRKLAAYLDIDQSTLSKIERNERRPTKEIIPILSKVFKIDIKDLKVKYLSEKILYEIQDEKHGLDALKVAEQTFSYSKSRKK